MSPNENTPKLMPEMPITQPEMPPKAPRKRKFRPVLLILDILIVVMAVSGLYLILKPIVIHKLQDNMTSELIDAFEQGDGTIMIDPTALEVEGEEVEYVDEYETFMTATSSSDSSVSSVSETTVPTQAPSPTPLPAKVVVKAIGRIKIPAINLNMPIAEGSTRYNLRVAIGHYSASADFGQPGYSIFLGHRMYTYGRHFNRLGEVKTGDKIIIEDKNYRYTYQVDQIDTILPAELIAALNTQTQEARIMLVTCTPVRVASHRLLVKGKLISTEALP